MTISSNLTTIDEALVKERYKLAKVQSKIRQLENDRSHVASVDPGYKMFTFGARYKAVGTRGGSTMYHWVGYRVDSRVYLTGLSAAFNDWPAFAKWCRENFVEMTPVKQLSTVGPESPSLVSPR